MKRMVDMRKLLIMGGQFMPCVLAAVGVRYVGKTIIDEIDELLAKHYGFTEEELDFIINYDIKYRMGDELNAAE